MITSPCFESELLLVPYGFKNIPSSDRNANIDDDNMFRIAASSQFAPVPVHAAILRKARASVAEVKFDAGKTSGERPRKGKRESPLKVNL